MDRIKTPGSGRKKGTPNKRTQELANLSKRAAESGETPLQYMLRVMRNRNAPVERRDDMAKAAAPYVHPRMAQIDPDTGKPPEAGIKIDILALARQVALALMLGDRMAGVPKLPPNGSET